MPVFSISQIDNPKNLQYGSINLSWSTINPVPVVYIIIALNFPGLSDREMVYMVGVTIIFAKITIIMSAA